MKSEKTSGHGKNKQIMIVYSRIRYGVGVACYPHPVLVYRSPRRRPALPDRDSVTTVSRTWPVRSHYSRHTSLRSCVYLGTSCLVPGLTNRLSNPNFPMYEKIDMLCFKNDFGELSILALLNTCYYREFSLQWLLTLCKKYILYCRTIPIRSEARPE